MSSQILSHFPELGEIVFHAQIDERRLLRKIPAYFLKLLVDGINRNRHLFSFCIATKPLTLPLSPLGRGRG
jgi:hypothetical protein